MKNLIKLLASLIFLYALTATLARAVTVGVFLLDPSTTKVTTNAYVRYELKNYGTAVPRVIGTNVILPSMIDVYPDNNGLVSKTLIGNDLIDPANTWYRVSYFKGGTKFYQCDVIIPEYMTGTVNTNGTTVTWVSGNRFPYALVNGVSYSAGWVGTTIVINGFTYTIAAVNSTTSLTLSTSAGVQSGAAYTHGNTTFSMSTATCLNATMPSAMPFASCPVCPAGPQGPPGTNGADGATGPQGPPGPAGGSVSCDPTKIVNYYIDPAGSDTTGDGTIGNPWKTINKAWAVIPYVVDGTYNINLKSAGTYIVGTTNLTNKFFPSGGVDYTSCGENAPCSSITISGDISSPETYIVRQQAGQSSGTDTFFVGPGISVTLRYMSIEGAGYGIRAIGDSRVTLGSVQFKNNYASVEVMDNAVVFVEIDKFLPVSGYNIFLTSASFNPTTGVAVNGNGLFTNWCTNYFGDVITPTYFACDMTGGTTPWLTRCAEALGGTFSWTGRVLSETNYFFAENGLFRVARLDYDGNSDTHSTYALTLNGSTFSGWFSGGAIYNISNKTNGVVLYGNSKVDNITFSGVTNTIVGGIEPGQTVGGSKTATFNNQIHTVVPDYLATPNVSINPAYGTVQQFTMTQNTTLAFANSGSGLDNGNQVTIIACQDGGGAHSLTDYVGNIRGLGTVSGTGSKCNSQTFMYNHSMTAWIATTSMITGW